MIGAIAGDIIGSVYEANPIKSTSFPLFSPHSRFTDDTVLTVAVAFSILNNVRLLLDDIINCMLSSNQTNVIAKKKTV